MTHDTLHLFLEPVHVDGVQVGVGGLLVLGGGLAAQVVTAQTLASVMILW